MSDSPEYVQDPHEVAMPREDDFAYGHSRDSMEQANDGDTMEENAMTLTDIGLEANPENAESGILALREEDAQEGSEPTGEAVAEGSGSEGGRKSKKEKKKKEKKSKKEKKHKHHKHKEEGARSSVEESATADNRTNAEEEGSTERKKHKHKHKKKKDKSKPEGNEDNLGDFIQHEGNSDDDDDDVIKVKGGINSEDDRSDSGEDAGHSSFFQGVLDNMRTRKKKKYKVSEAEMQMFIGDVLRRMREAADYDAEALRNNQPATAKLQLLEQCVREMSKPKFVQWFVQEGACQVLSDWLAPLDDGSLPNITIRTELLKLLSKMPINCEDLKGNDLGKRLVAMWHHAEETDQNMGRIRSLIAQWLRPLMGSSSDCREHQERQAQSQEQLDQRGVLQLRSSIPTSTRVDLDDEDPDNKRRRAVPPRSMGYNFTIQPKSDMHSHQQLDGNRGGRNRGAPVAPQKRIPLDPARNFNIPRKAQKVSIEGRGLYQ
eukprot:GHVS01080701.1.p2 GENE.GHVS01080701.1~~GHVS01080701.1.p2  ORF type:complete len:517 (+),score=87.05 GHVS01080701.1:89-1552(+)